MQDDLQELQAEYDRVCHEDDCEGRLGHKCRCGCGSTVICPGGSLCRNRIVRLTGREETDAVRGWMKLGLCICAFVVKNKDRGRVGQIHLPELGYYEGDDFAPDRQFTKASGNWSARRRRKLVRCPCGAYFDNATVRALGLYSESEWARMGFPYFNGGERYYIENALRHAPVCLLPHVRRGPLPVARIWRPFYDPAKRRFEAGLASVDLFSADQVDLTRFVLSNRQAAALMDGDRTVLDLIVKHRPTTKRRRRPKWTVETALREYQEETGFSLPVPK